MDMIYSHDLWLNDQDEHFSLSYVHCVSLLVFIRPIVARVHYLDNIVVLIRLKHNNKHVLYSEG